MKKRIISFALILIAQISFAQEETFKTDVIKYLDLSGVSPNFNMAIDKLIDHVPEDKKTDFKKEMGVAVEDLIDRMADVYMTEFSHNDIKEILQFYATPFGKKVSEKTKSTLEKTQEIGEEWAMGLQDVLIKYMH